MSSSGKDHQEEVEYVTMVRLPRGCGDGSLLLPHPLESEYHTHVDTADEGEWLQKCLHTTSQPWGLGPNTGQKRARLSKWLRILQEVCLLGQRRGSFSLWMKVIWGSFQNGRPDLPPLRSFLSHQWSLFSLSDFVTFCFPGSFSQGGDFIRRSVFGQLGSGAYLQQHWLPRCSRSQDRP